MDVELSDEEFVLPQQHVNFALTVPELEPQHIASVPATAAVVASNTGRFLLPKSRANLGRSLTHSTDLNAEPGTANADIKQAAFGRFAFRGRNSNSGRVTVNATMLSKDQIVDSPEKVQEHSRQQNMKHSKNKPVRMKKRNINASIFDESDDDAVAIANEMAPHADMQPDVPTIIVSSERLWEVCAKFEAPHGPCSGGRSYVPYAFCAVDCLSRAALLSMTRITCGNWQMLYIDSWHQLLTHSSLHKQACTNLHIVQEGMEAQHYISEPSMGRKRKRMCTPANAAEEGTKLSMFAMRKYTASAGTH